MRTILTSLLILISPIQAQEATKVKIIDKTGVGLVCVELSNLKPIPISERRYIITDTPNGYITHWDGISSIGSIGGAAGLTKKHPPNYDNMKKFYIFRTAANMQLPKGTEIYVHLEDSKEKRNYLSKPIPVYIAKKWGE